MSVYFGYGKGYLSLFTGELQLPSGGLQGYGNRLFRKPYL